MIENHSRMDAFSHGAELGAPFDQLSLRGAKNPLNFSESHAERARLLRDIKDW